MSDELKAYYEYQACLMEPWDGPASMAFTDGTVIGAVLDRNGLRPSRYWVTKDGHVIMASEAGVLDIPPEDVESKGRLQPGRMFLVDTAQGRIIADDEIKNDAGRRGSRIASGSTRTMITLADLPTVPPVNGHLDEPLLKLQRAFGYTLEDLQILLAPMATDGARSRSARWATTRRWPCSPTGRSCSTTTSSSCSPRSPTRRSMRFAKRSSRR